MSYSIEVWDIQFFKKDQDGNYLLNDDGSVKLFTDCGNMDASYLADHVTDSDLWEVES